MWSLSLIGSLLKRALELITIDLLRIIYYIDAKNHRS